MHPVAQFVKTVVKETTFEWCIEVAPEEFWLLVNFAIGYPFCSQRYITTKMTDKRITENFPI